MYKDLYAWTDWEMSEDETKTEKTETKRQECNSSESKRKENRNKGRLDSQRKQNIPRANMRNYTVMKSSLVRLFPILLGESLNAYNSISFTVWSPCGSTELR